MKKNTNRLTLNKNAQFIVLFWTINKKQKKTKKKRKSKKDVYLIHLA